MARIRITSVSEGGPETWVRVAKRDIADAAVEVGKIWFRHTLPEHFETSAVNKYGYQPRTAKYMKRKARQKGHQRPLTWSGEMRTEILSYERVDRTRHGAAVKLYGPRYFFAFRKDYGQADKAAEVTRVTVAEEQAMASMIGRMAARNLQQRRDRRVRVR